MLSLGTVHTSNDKVSMNALAKCGKGSSPSYLYLGRFQPLHVTSVRVDQSDQLKDGDLLLVCSVIMAIKSDIDTSSMTSSHPLVVVPTYLATSRSNPANKASANSDHSAARSSLDLFLAGWLQVSALCLSYAIVPSA